MEHTAVIGVFTQVASNIKGFARKCACKSTYASCVNGTFGMQNVSLILSVDIKEEPLDSDYGEADQGQEALDTGQEDAGLDLDLEAAADAIGDAAQCKICERVFSTHACLRAHLDAQFRCDICCRGLSSAGRLGKNYVFSPLDRSAQQCFEGMDTSGRTLYSSSVRTI